MSWMWRAAASKPQPARAVDVADAQRPFPVEDVGVAVGHRHHYFVQAHGFAPAALLPIRRVPQALALEAPDANHAKRRRVRTPIAIDRVGCQLCEPCLRNAGTLARVAKTFVGSRVRQLRSERGFSQAALAQMLEISPSYLNQIEHDVRPLTVAVLLRITEVFGVDATFFASQDDTRLVAELREVTMDRDLDIDVDPPEVAEMVSAHPAPGARGGQPAPALPDHHRAAGRRHRGAVLRRQRQRVDHHAARRGARLLLSSARTTCTSWTPPPRTSRSRCGCTAATWPAS